MERSRPTMERRQSSRSRRKDALFFFSFSFFFFCLLYFLSLLWPLACFCCFFSSFFSFFLLSLPLRWSNCGMRRAPFSSTRPCARKPTVEFCPAWTGRAFFIRMPQLLFLQISTRDSPFVCSLSASLAVEQVTKGIELKAVKLRKRERNTSACSQRQASTEKETACNLHTGLTRWWGFISFPARKGKKKKGKGSRTKRVSRRDAPVPHRISRPASN